MKPFVVKKCLLPLLMRRTWPRVLALARELEASQWWPPARLGALQLERLNALLKLAREQSPFYRERLAQGDGRAWPLADLEELSRLPILEKEELQAERERILLEGVARHEVTESATGGTTGEPTRYYWDDEYWCRSSAVSQRVYGYAGFEIGDPHCMIWGTAFHKGSLGPLKARFMERLKNVLVVPGFELSEESLRAWARRVARQRPRLVEGYTSLLMLFGSYLLQHGIRDIRPRRVISSAEKLYPFQRELIEEAFQAPVLDRYGSREVGCIAHECDARSGLHINSEHLLVEIVRGQDPLPVGESGEILVTSLSNHVFPFIRYRIGDMGRLLPDPCPCGRGLPLLEITEGRVHDLITTARGTWLPGEFFPHLFKEYAGVGSFLVHQARDLSVTISIVKTSAFEPRQEEDYRRQIQKVLGPGLPVTYQDVEVIPPTPSGKLRFTESEVPVDLTRGLPEGLSKS